MDKPWIVDFALAYDGGGYSEWTQYYRTKLGARVSIFWHKHITSWGGTAKLYKKLPRVEDIYHLWDHDITNKIGVYMPPVRTYVVTQERETKISASDPTEAVRLANSVFNPDPSAPPEDQYRAEVKETAIQAREEF